MKYTGMQVHELSRIAGVSPRTLRYYDQIGLLSPSRYSPSGYRLYSNENLDRLQHILLLKEMDVPLSKISGILDDSGEQREDLLKGHRRELQKRMERLKRIIETINKTIESDRKGDIMSPKEKFNGLAEKLIAENEQKYGTEARKLYGDETVDRSNASLRGKSEKQIAAFEELSKRQLDTLYRAMEDSDPGSEIAQEAALLHREFLEFWYPDYNAAYHAGMVEMYIQDDRFREFYDKGKAGAAEFLRDAVKIYLERNF